MVKTEAGTGMVNTEAGTGMVNTERSGSSQQAVSSSQRCRAIHSKSTIDKAYFPTSLLPTSYCLSDALEERDRDGIPQDEQQYVRPRRHLNRHTEASSQARSSQVKSSQVKVRGALKLGGWR